MVSLKIQSITFSGGQKLSIGRDDKIVIVGSNNSGKSKSLKEICEFPYSSRESRVCVDHVDLLKKGSVEDLREELKVSGSFDGVYYNSRGVYLNYANVDAWEYNNLTAELLGLFFRRVSPEERLNISKDCESIPASGQKSKPQHILYDSENMMKKVSDLFFRAFDKNLMIDFRGGASIPIYVGESPPAELVDRVGDTYVDFVRKYPRLQEQGDGMRSYAGILFEVISTERDVIFLDEPEAFLHPPQMRKLGYALASEVTSQMFVATHSSDILRGFLEGAKGGVRIVRITRNGDKNYVTEASLDAVAELWSKPALRYSNAFDAMFHEEAIICEDSSDCRLFNAFADHLSAEGVSIRDTAYIPTGGKQMIAKVAKVLREVGVPVKAVYDMDLLSDWGALSDAIISFGGETSNLEALWKRVDASLRKGFAAESFDSMKGKLQEVLQRCDKVKDLQREAKAVLKPKVPWSPVKNLGQNGLPRGDVRNYFSDLVAGLEELGIYLVPVGEVENFVPEIGVHGPAYVTKLLDTIGFDDGRVTQLKDFVERVHLAPLPALVPACAPSAQGLISRHE